MTWGEPPRDSSDSSSSFSSGVFNAAGVQVKGTCGSSFVTDVIKVERQGNESAVKILTPGASTDPDLVNRFLVNARYNQGLNDFTGLKISEIIDKGPRLYYVMDTVAQSSLLEVIRLHAPLDPIWLATLMLPIARMLDTVHQRNILHGNIKPSNILIKVENNEEKFMLVDYLEPSLVATSATLTGAGVYAAPEFRAGTPVSNRSDIYSLSSVMYEALTASLPVGAYRGADGAFHVWRNSNSPRPLHQVNPEISIAASEAIMNGLDVQAVSRPPSASALVEQTLRALEQPRARVRVGETVEEKAPVPMLLIGIGAFLAVLLLLGVFAFTRSIFTSDDPKTSTTQAASTTSGTQPDDDTLTPEELSLANLLPEGNQVCKASRDQGDSKRWPKANAILNCTSPELTTLYYGSFDNVNLLNETFRAQQDFLKQGVESAGGAVVASPEGPNPCTTNPNESGEWGPKDRIKEAGGKFICVSTPEPKIIWTERNTGLIGEAGLSNGNISTLVEWWRLKSGPK